MELKQISVEMVKLRTKVDPIGKAIDEICEYKFNVKVVGLPEVYGRESAQQTGSFCFSLFSALGADVQFTPTIPEPPRRKTFIPSIRARTNWVILLQFLEQKYGIAFQLEYAESRELLLNKKFETSPLKFSTPKTVMLTHPLCWIK